ncbi:MAG: hypothetical protein IJ325_11670 [Clostridia bacterium]|nr:hypothetical protein [Clostridia bacterium]
MVYTFPQLNTHLLPFSELIIAHPSLFVNKKVKKSLFLVKKVNISGGLSRENYGTNVKSTEPTGTGNAAAGSDR